MSVIGKKTKGTIAIKAAKSAAKRPRLLLATTKVAAPSGKAALKVSKPLLKRRARKRLEGIESASHKLGHVLAVEVPRAAYDLGLAESPKPKRTAPRVAAGVVIGASAMYFLEPEHGKEHREQIAQLVS